MTKDEIFEKMRGVLSVVRPTADIDKITYDTVLVKDLALDSLSMLLMGLAIEKEFDVRFEDNIQFVTVGDVYDAILKLLDAKKG